MFALAGNVFSMTKKEWLQLLKMTVTQRPPNHA